MRIFGLDINRRSKIEVEKRDNAYETYYGAMTFGSYSSFAASKALTLSACYRAVNLISDAIASLQMKTYRVDSDGYKTEDKESQLYSVLGIEPNSQMSRFDFFKLIITAILLRGNAYVKINRDKDFNVTGLVFINPDTVKISTVGIDVKYIVYGQKGMINNADMIHITNYPQIGSPYGVSTIAYAAKSLAMAYNSETHAGNWFKGGANSSGFLQTSANLSPKQQADIIKLFKASTNVDTGNPNGITLLSGLPDMSLQTLGISPKDSQLLETRAFNVVEIGRFFNVNPILLFDSTKGTYSNVENAQLDFLNTSLLPFIEKLENEFTRKLILPSDRTSNEIRFDLSNLLRADSTSRADYYTKLFGLGVLTSNQIAKDLNLPKIDGEGGDRHFVSTNLQDSSNLIVNADSSIDNKLK